MNLAEELRSQAECLNPIEEETLGVIKRHLKEQANQGFGGTFITLRPDIYGYNKVKIISSLQSEGLQVIQEEWSQLRGVEAFKYIIRWSESLPISEGLEPNYIRGLTQTLPKLGLIE